MRADHERVAVGRHGDTKQILGSGFRNGEHVRSDPPRLPALEDMNRSRITLSIPPRARSNEDGVGRGRNRDAEVCPRQQILRLRACRHSPFTHRQDRSGQHDTQPVFWFHVMNGQVQWLFSDTSQRRTSPLQPRRAIIARATTAACDVRQHPSETRPSGVPAASRLGVRDRRSSPTRPSDADTSTSDRTPG